MNKSIDTLVDDIHALFTDDYEPDSRNVEEFGKRLSVHVGNRLSENRGAPTLRLSNVGTPCDRKLWYTINTPEAGEKLPVSTRIKFLFGDILEELFLFLAKEAGHTVEGTQDELSVEGIVGHRDAVIDGHLVDVKSASSYAYRKFKEHRLADDDPFGYIGQLKSYLVASRGSSDGLVKDTDTASFLVIDKQLGHLTLDTHSFTPDELAEVPEQIKYKKEMVKADVPPDRAYEPVPDGKSGNMKLGVECSYCPFKNKCWPGLRTFAYSDGPRFLTEVKFTPKVQEITEYAF